MRRAGFLFGLAFMAVAPARAGSLEVAPTSVELPAKGGTAELRLVNHGDRQSDVQVEAFAWTQAGTETLSDSDDIVLSPPQARLAPHSSQIVRVLVQPGGGTPAERAFRIVATELPGAEKSSTGTRVLLQFVVPLFAGDGTRAASALRWTLHREAKGLRLDAQNAGPRRAKFTHLELVGPERLPVASGSLVYVLAGSTRSWSFPAATGGSWHLEAIDEIAGKRISVPLAVSD